MRLILTAAMAAIAMPVLAADASSLHVRLPPPTLQAEQGILPMHARLGPQSREFVAREGAKFAGGAPIDEAALRTSIAAAGLGASTPADIDALVTLVMMQCAQDATDDMRDLLAEMKATSERKKATRNAIDASRAGQRSAAPTVPVKIARAPQYLLDKPGRRPLDEQVKEIKEKADTLGDLSEDMQLRLQMYQDRYSKLMETLSNIMKKSSETSSSIISNMK